MLINRRSLLSTGIAATAALTVGRKATAQDTTRISVALDWFPNSNHAGLFWAQANELFAARQLEVSLVIPADPTVVLQTVAAGRDTFGISYQPDILLARAQELPLVAVAAIVPRPLLGIMSLQSSGITRPKDLVGKKVGYTGIPSQEAFLKTMLQSDGVSIADIELNNIEFNLLPSLISNQSVAVMGAYWTHETIVAEREGYPVDLMHVEDWGVPLYDELVLVTAERTLKDQPEMVADVVAAIRGGYLASAANQSRALDILVSAHPETDRDVEQQGLALLAGLWTEPDPGFGYIQPEAWATFAAWMAEQMLLPEDFSIDGIIAPLAVSETVATPIS